MKVKYVTEQPDGNLRDDENNTTLTKDEFEKLQAIMTDTLFVVNVDPLQQSKRNK